MKNLNGKELMRGDIVLYATSDGIVAGAIHQFYDRNEGIRIANYPFHVPAKDTVLAQDAHTAFAVPLLKERQAAEEQAKLDKAKADAEERAKANAEAAAKAKEVPTGAPATPPEPPKASEPIQTTPEATGPS